MTDHDVSRIDVCQAVRYDVSLTRIVVMSRYVASRCKSSIRDFVVILGYDSSDTHAMLVMPPYGMM